MSDLDPETRYFPRTVTAALMSIGKTAILIVDHALRVIAANDLAGRLLGSTGNTADLLDRTLHEILVVDRYNRALVVDQLVLNTIRLKECQEYGSGLTLHTPDALREEIRLTVTPIEEIDKYGGRTPAAVISVEPIGDQLRMTRDLQKLQHTENMRIVAGGISRELLNCATALHSDVDIISRHGSSNASDGYGDAAHRIQTAIRKVRRLGLQLDRFGRNLHDEADDNETTTADVPEIVHDTISLVAGSTPVRTTFTFDGDIPPAGIPPQALTQALFNVALNAVEAMDDDGILRIEVHFRGAEDAIHLVVRDNGTGMDPRLVAEAFRPYFSTKAHGIGMGLTISLSILEQYGGQLMLETEPGFGTTVTMIIPPASSASGNAEKSSVHAPIALTGIRVLMVEDDSLVRRSMERMIAHLGCSVTAVHSGDRAIEVFRSSLATGKMFDILVTDLTMPGRVDGVDLVQRLREFTPELPAVLSSGALHRKNARWYGEGDFQYVLRKPFGEREMHEALTAALTTYRRYA